MACEQTCLASRQAWHGCVASDALGSRGELGVPLGQHAVSNTLTNVLLA